MMGGEWVEVGSAWARRRRPPALPEVTGGAAGRAFWGVRPVAPPVEPMLELAQYHRNHWNHRLNQLFRRQICSLGEKAASVEGGMTREREFCR